jgi:hypothetical protein
MELRRRAASGKLPIPRLESGQRREEESVAGKQKPNKAVLAAIVVVHLAVARLTWRDLRARPAEQIRGSKRFWRVASGVNTVGSIGYWLLGRRRDAR